ncbi:sensor histidine kinase [Agromyces protaetiae]|uniref:histidine kinase n=1 Tax=Agromyces protaetiae TaxID=2509455 RepID=A0A4P6FE81_9MICO|nr:sensor histidine kinase [Agromyces protaetiae]QAY74442.1 sensor histidine kinase [Agromyces protaetiae]
MPGGYWSERGPQPGGFRPPAVLAVVIPAVVSFLVQVPASVGIAVWTHESASTAALSISLAVAGPLALLASRRWPGPTVAVVAALALADVLLLPDIGPPYIAVGFAIILGVARGALVWTAVSAGVAWVAAVVLGTLAGVDWHPIRIAATTAALALCFGIGWFIRVRRGRAQAYRVEAQRRRQIAEQRERVRIARELHDVIGHALSQIHVQASVGLHLMDRDPEQARQALATVKETSKLALDEVRSVVGVIRMGDAPLAPQAELDQLPRLVAGVRSPDLDVSLDDRLGATQADRPGRSVQWAVYRIAQEALTNIVRHAHASHASVCVERAADDVVVTVEDDGRGFDSEADVSGAGLLGMRERAELLGGEIELVPREGGGTRVVARLPWSAV